MHLRDGTELRGRLTSCDDEICVMARQRVERGRIARIVLADGAAVPPGTPPGAILTDGSVRPGRLTDLNIGYVSIGETELPRDEVAVILLVAAPAAAAPPPSGPIVRPSPPPPAPMTGTPPAPPPPSPPPPQPVPQPVPQPSDGPARRGRLWSGQIIGRAWTNSADERTRVDVTIDVKLREYKRDIVSAPPELKKVGEITYLNEEGSVVHNAYRGRTGPESCSGAGESPAIHRPPGNWSSVIYQSLDRGALSRALGYEVTQDTFYALAVIPNVGSIPMYQWTCFDGYETRTTSMLYHVVTAGRFPWESVLVDPQLRSVQGGRLFGSYTVATPGHSYEHATASWSVCVEGVACPPPTPLDPPEPDAGGTPPPADPCARSGQQQALADTCTSQLDAMVTALEPLFAEYKGLMEIVDENRDDFEAMEKYCLAYDIVQEVLETILKGGTNQAAKAGQALLELRDLIGKIQDGSIVEEFYPDQVGNVLDLYNEARSVWVELTADDITLMRGSLDDCSGKAPTSTYMAAKTFVDTLATSRQFWDSRLAPAINNVRAKGQECANRNHAAWRACFEDAQCRGETPNCGPEPSLDGMYDR